MNAIAHRSYFLPVMAALVTLAWLTLWLWEQSPYGRYLNHAELASFDPRDGFGGVLLSAALYVVGWVLMSAAMMLPTTLPLLEIFRRLTRRRPDHGRLMALVVVGYLAVWLAFGVAAHAFDLVLHELFEITPWLQENPWVFGAGPLAVAGAFQFSALKHRCLEKCRTPMSFVMEHWRGRRERWYAFLLGVNHGIFCVGCCWAIMFLMFAVGTGNVGWMLALGAVMAVEKNMPWGRRLSTPLGIGLLGWAALIAVNSSWSWQY
jgi:predicted metal-binding membrane protein